jgi:hypothetical protein
LHPVASNALTLTESCAETHTTAQHLATDWLRDKAAARAKHMHCNTPGDGFSPNYYSWELHIAKLKLLMLAYRMLLLLLKLLLLQALLAHLLLAAAAASCLCCCCRCCCCCCPFALVRFWYSPAAPQLASSSMACFSCKQQHTGRSHGCQQQRMAGHGDECAHRAWVALLSASLHASAVTLSHRCPPWSIRTNRKSAWHL